MASINNRPNGHRWIQFTDAEGKRQTLRLGKTTKKNAEEVCRRVEHLLAAKIAGDTPDRQTLLWLESIRGKLRDRLVALDLAAAARERRKLHDWIDEFKKRNPQWKPSSIENFDAAATCLREFFPADRYIDSIRPHEAEDFRKWLLVERFNRQTGGKGHADDTVRRRCGRAKAIFKEAVKRKLAESNPFEDIVTTTRGNAGRQHFVEASVAIDCINAAPCIDWRTIIALCRFGGLRCPSEIINLTWSDVNLPEGFMILRQPKVEHHEGGGVRVCPIFVELRPYLEAAWDAAPERTTHVVNRYRDQMQNLRTTFEKIITRAGHRPWPRLFQNLRATRETELLGRFPAKDVTQWIGNSIAVAMDHYAMPTQATFKAATTTPINDLTSSTPPPAPASTEGDVKPDASSRQTRQIDPTQNPKQHPAAGSIPKRQTPQKPASNEAQPLEVAGIGEGNQLPGSYSMRTRASRAGSL